MHHDDQDTTPNTPQPTVDEEVDAILNESEKAFTYYHKSHDASAGTSKREAKTAILTLIATERTKTLDEVEAAVIGEDETGGYARGVQPVRNRFRAEQRKAYGNAIVPQVAMEIMKAIKEVDDKQEMLGAETL